MSKSHVYILEKDGKLISDAYVSLLGLCFMHNIDYWKAHRGKPLDNGMEIKQIRLHKITGRGRKSF